ncbi:MAG: TolC family protein [Saprospiraceae bacterium]|nr:TolC family protein [Saprospiraceae bacterium]
MKWSRLGLIVPAILLCFPVLGQELLTLQEAIELGLENNYGIKISRNQEAIATNNNNRGNAGMLPTLNTNGNVSYTSNNTRQKFFSGDERSGTGAGNTSIRLGAALNWTAFDGFQMYARKERLELDQAQSKVFTRQAMQDLVSQIQTLYYGLVRINQQIDITRQSITLNEDLRNLASGKLQIGTGTNLEVLQTRNRVNTDSSTLLNLENTFRQNQIAMNRLMGRTVGIEFTVPLEIPEALLPKLEALTPLALDQNYDMRLLKLDEQIALTQIREARSALYPTVSVNLGYNYNFSRAEVGFLLSNRTFGPTAGLSFNYDLFPGRNIKRDIDNATILQQNIQLTQSDLQQDIEASLSEQYQNYQALIGLESVERKSLEIAEQNTALSRQLYRSGRATNFDVREAILSETQIKDRISEVIYRKKLTEIEIKRLAGIPMEGVE